MSPAALGPEAGAFVGCMNQEYFDVLALGGGALTAAAATGNSLSFMVGRCERHSGFLKALPQI